MLEYFTHSPYFYDYVLGGVLFLAAFNIFEIAFLIYNKRKVERSELRKLELKRLASTALVTATSPADLLPRPSHEDEFAAYSESIASVLESFQGEIAEKARKLLGDLGIDAHYRRLARHRTWYKRGNAVDILASFRLPANREFFLAVFRSETEPEVKYRLIHGLSFLVRGHADIRRLAEMLSSLPYLTSKYTENIFYNSISAMGEAQRPEEFGLFMKELLAEPSVSTLVKRDILTACYAASCEKGRPILREYYKAYQHEPEIVMAALRALARVGDFSFIPESLGNPDWRVRMAALRSADMCCTDMIPEIRRMLTDASYHVRIAAAQMLARSGDTGVAVLRAEARSEDRFAAEAAAYALTQVPA